MRRCDLYKARSRPGTYCCGARGGKCVRKDDNTISCPIRDGGGQP